VPVAAVGEFVGDDEPHLCRWGLLEQGVGNDDAARPAEPGHVRVRFVRATAGVLDEHVAHRHAGPPCECVQLRRQCLVPQRRVAVEQRFEHDRGQERKQQRRQRERRCRRRHPPARQRTRRQGVLVQELIQPQGCDLRVLVAAGEIVGAVKRVAAPGEWRTNIALGGARIAADPPPQARLIALGAAAALGTDLVGVDLLPDGKGGWVVLELNGAVDFTPEYSLGGESVFERVVEMLARPIRGDSELSGARVSELFGRLLREPAVAYTGNAEEEETWQL
jgi:hypothetical protein